MKQIILSAFLNGKTVLALQSRSLYMPSPGPCHKLRSEASRKDFFYLISGHDFIDLVPRLPFARTKFATYHAVSADCPEISAFFGLNIQMEINELFTIRLYLNSDLFLGNPGFKKTILLRFQAFKSVFTNFVCGPRGSN